MCFFSLPYSVYFDMNKIYESTMFFVLHLVILFYLFIDKEQKKNKKYFFMEFNVDAKTDQLNKKTDTVKCH